MTATIKYARAKGLLAELPGELESLSSEQQQATALRQQLHDAAEEQI